MSFVSSDEYMRLGRKVGGEADGLNDAVQAALRDHAAYMTGDWWERWMGWYGAWTQFRSANIDKVPFIPVQDTSDVDQWAKEVDAWKADLARIQLSAPAAQQHFQGPTGSATESHGPSVDSVVDSVTPGKGFLKIAAIVGGLALGAVVLLPMVEKKIVKAVVS